MNLRRILVLVKCTCKVKDKQCIVLIDIYAFTSLVSPPKDNQFE